MKKTKAPPMAPASGTIMSGLSIHSFPHAGLGSLTPTRKIVITVRAIPAPINVGFTKDAGWMGGVVKWFLLVMVNGFLVVYFKKK